jgi:hypothetical protein
MPTYSRSHLKIHMHKDIFDDMIKVLICQKDFEGRLTAAGTHVVLEYLRPEDEGILINPTFTIDHDAAQQLLNELWHLGFRPADGTGSAGQLQATEKHLEDMRQMVFHAYKVNKE